MEKLTLKEIAEYTTGKIYGEPSLTVIGVEIDSRKVAEGDLFVALKGERSDGHQFVTTALEKCTAALVEKAWVDESQVNLPAERGFVAVESTEVALQVLAKRYRERFAIPVIGVTGSCGKTSTKDMIAAALGEKINVHKSLGNFNNELGLPLTLLKLNKVHQAAVVEMGMRGRGQIKFLTSLAQPNIAVITNIGTTHMELLGSQENIALAKGEILEALPEDGVAVLNGDDPWCKKLSLALKNRIILYGIDQADVDLRAYDIAPNGEQGTFFKVSFAGEEAEVFLPVPGRHNVSNALAAIGVGISLNLSLAECARGLAGLEMTGMRLEICAGANGIKVINDTYNANPTSTRASLEVLAERGKEAPKIAILGSMFELGESAEQGHRQVGAFAAGIPGMAYLVTVGDLGKFIALGAVDQGMEEKKIHSFEDTAEALDFLRERMPQGAWILVKGSRGMKMERVVEGLLQDC